MISPESIACTVLTSAVRESGREVTSRHQRAIDMVAAGVAIVAEMRGRYRVQSSDGQSWYKVTDRDCSCPDGKKGNDCKHMLAVSLLPMYGEELSRRLCRKWSGDVDDVDALASEYVQLMRECAGYEPPAAGFLTSFGIEVLREDLNQDWRRGGHRQLPPLVRMRYLQPPKPWCAKITGLDAEFEFRREFMRGHKDYRGADKKFKRGVWIYWELPEGLYEAQELEHAYPMPIGKRFFFNVENQTVTRIKKSEVLACLRGSPVPSSVKCQP